MGRKKGLDGFSTDELMAELAKRVVDEKGGTPTMTDMELGWERLVRGGDRAPPIAAMLSRMKPEKPTAKACPRCGQRTPIKARARERTVRSLAGEVTFSRNYHDCVSCEHGFYPVDRMLGLPEEGEVSEELERRILDFGVNDTFDEAAERWNTHDTELPISSNLVRRVVDRVGRRLEAADERQLQLNLKVPSTERDDLVIVETDGSMLPIRGHEPWKEAKVGVIVRPYKSEKKRRRRRDARYVAVLGPQAEFKGAMENALEVEQVHRAKQIVWVGDGAPANWNLASTLCPQALQILDWYHAIEPMMTCGRSVLGESDPMVRLWRSRSEALLASGDVDGLVDELMDCIVEAKDEHLAAFDDLIRYVRTNESRMRYDEYLAKDFPIGSGIAESAHRHVLQLRMKRAGQRWSLPRARRMARMRAAYRTSGAGRFHRAIRATPPARTTASPPKKRLRASNH
jgi:hypothetical protein